MRTKDHDASCHQTFVDQFSCAQGQTNQLRVHTLIRPKEVPQQTHRQSARVHRWREEPHVIVHRRIKSTDADAPLPRATQYGENFDMFIGARSLPSVVSHMWEEVTDPGVRRVHMMVAANSEAVIVTRQQARIPRSQPCVTGAMMNVMSTETSRQPGKFRS